MTPELLSPAGGFDAALAAFQYGADAVYLGLPRFSARADADNLTPERLRTLLAYARSFTPAKKIYVTFNTLVQDAELPQALETLDSLDELAPDGVIVQDLGVARLIRERFPRLALHASTQLAAHNLDGVLALKALGFTRVVLARELTLDEIRQLVRDSGVEIEIFVHGALCYSFSGLCLFSSHTAGRSGNRGRCAYCCREAFRTEDPQPGDLPAAPTAYAFSMKDLALAPLLGAVVAAGAHSLKIEGRMKSPLYVACVTDYYRRKLDGRLTPEAERALIQDLQTVFSRPWTRLYAEGPDASPESIIDPVGIGHRGALIGRAEAVTRDRDGTCWLRFTTDRALEKHDGLQVELPGGGKPFGCGVSLLRAVGSLRTVITLPAGSAVEVALPEQDVPMIPRGAPVFCSASQAVRRRYEIQNLRASALPSGQTVNIRVALAPDGVTARAETTLATPGDVTAELFLPLSLTPSRQPEQTHAAVRKAFERLGDTAWQLGALALDDPHACYAPPSKLNEARRAVLEQLSAEWTRCRAERRAAIAASWGLAPSEATHHDDISARQPGSGAASRAGRNAKAFRSEKALTEVAASSSADASPCWTLKLRADTPPLPPDALTEIDTLVLAIGHTPLHALEPQLAAWRSMLAPDRIRLALPLITRAHETPELKATLRSLVQSGWNTWECADLAGCRMLGEQGLEPASSDWSLYALNRVAAAELARLGVASFVLSPENSLDNIRSLCGAGVSPVSQPSPTVEQTVPPLPAPELLAFQHTPLFISETAPCLPLREGDKTVTLADRRGRAFVTQKLDGRWVTVAGTPYCIADRLAASGLSRFRIDLSWSPDANDFSGIIRSVTAGRLPPGSHCANFDRGFA
jgi:putative protease